MYQTSNKCANANAATAPATMPRSTSEPIMRRSRGKRSTATPPSSRKISMGVIEQISTVPIAVAEPVFSSTHHASATRYRLSPKREIVCPLHSRANERCFSDRNSTITFSLWLNAGRRAQEVRCEGVGAREAADVACLAWHKAKQQEIGKGEQHFGRR